MQSEQLLQYLQQGIEQLIAQEAFDGGQEFRPTQKEALAAYKNFLSDERLSAAERLKGFFEIPTGVGKTAVFVGIVAAAHKVALLNDDALKTAIVVPTIQLLDQTQKAFNKFAPQIGNQIGLYGGGDKELSQPLTIMTYDAWFDLSQKGAISSANIDILISDEAHRGTSERRIENIQGVFNDTTAQIAFTATAHFDEEKSVQASHQHQIFYKPMRDAIQEGELAAYVQSQRAVIRVEPTEYMLSAEFANESQGEQIKYRRALRHKAWNDFAVQAFREGIDERTGDLLTDNQTGFFVDGIKQADDLENLLNDDEELQRRAKEQGYEGVAIAIHSGLHPKEQERRFEAYLNGEYLAVIGDEKFKEGFDHPPMKTLFDYHRGSVVDKVQILGRGARQWWNEAKQRYEGLTVIDTAIYIGSKDQAEDRKRRDEALTSAVSVKNVLEDPMVIGPDGKIKGYRGLGGSTSGGGGSNGGEAYFVDNLNIEYYSDVESIHAIEAEVEKLRLGYSITLNDIIQAIDSYRSKNAGALPSQDTEEHVNLECMGVNVSWRSINYSLVKGANRLDEDADWNILKAKYGEGKLTLNNLLIELGYQEKSLELNIQLIRESIDAYRAQNGGNNPRISSGLIKDGPLKSLTTWVALNASLTHGRNCIAEDSEWQELNIKLGNGTLTLPSLLIELGYEKKTNDLTIDDIRRTIEAYKLQNNKNPNSKSGEVTVGPLAGSGKWRNIDTALLKGQKGLKNDPEWLKLSDKFQGNLTLVTFLEDAGYKKKMPVITMQIITQAIDAFREANKQKNPKACSKKIVDGDLADLMTWDSFYATLLTGAHGLKNDIEWQKLNEKFGEGNLTLPALLVELGYKEKTLNLTIELLARHIAQYRQDNAGNGPNVNSGVLKSKELEVETNWAAVNQALSIGRNNLKDDPDWQRLSEKHGGKLTLVKLCQEYPYQPDALQEDCSPEGP